MFLECVTIFKMWHTFDYITIFGLPILIPFVWSHLTERWPGKFWVYVVTCPLVLALYIVIYGEFLMNHNSWGLEIPIFMIPESIVSFIAAGVLFYSNLKRLKKNNPRPFVHSILISTLLLFVFIVIEYILFISPFVNW